MPDVADTALVGAPTLVLSAYLGAHIADFGPIARIQKFAGGQSNPTFKLSTVTRQYVLRRKPAGPVLASAHRVDCEHRGSQALYGTAVLRAPDQTLD